MQFKKVNTLVVNFDGSVPAGTTTPLTLAIPCSQPEYNEFVQGIPTDRSGQKKDVLTIGLQLLGVQLHSGSYINGVANLELSSQDMVIMGADANVPKEQRVGFAQYSRELKQKDEQLQTLQEQLDAANAKVSDLESQVASLTPETEVKSEDDAPEQETSKTTATTDKVQTPAS